MDNEDVFASEAQEETILARRRSAQSTGGDDNGKDHVRTLTTEGETSDTEQQPLIGHRRRGPRGPYTRAAESYQRAINEPWTGARGGDQLPWHKRPSIFWLLPAFFPFCLAFGGTIVPKQYLVLDLICRDYLSDRATHDPTFQFSPVIFGGDNPQCRIPEVQSLVSNFNLYQSFLSGIFAAIVAPHLGALSDRVGRKKVMVAASLGGFAMEIITIIVGSYPDRISVYWILLGALLDGLCGSFTTGMALAFAYASDCTSPERRATAFGFFHGMLFTGIGFGPIMAGAFMKLTGTVMIAFYIALGCHVFFMLFILLFLPESLSKDRQVLAREKYAEEWSKSSGQKWTQTVKAYNMFEPLWVLRPRGPGSSKQLRRNLFLLAAIDTMMFGVAMGTMQIILIYAQYRFGWDEFAASMYLSAVNVTRVLGLVAVLPLLTRFVRGRMHGHSEGHKGSDKLDIGIIRAATVFDLLGYIGYAFSPSGSFMVVSGLIASLGGIGSPTLQSSLTKHVPANLTGQVLGASALLHALARVVAPMVFNLIYSKTVKIYAGIVFICLGSIFVLVFVMSWFLRTDVYLKEDAGALSTRSGDDDDDDDNNYDGGEDENR